MRPSRRDDRAAADDEGVEEVVVVSRKLFPLTGKVVLVVDDEPDQREFLATVFEDNGATVFRAANGDEALALARRETPDLLTLDLEMPGRSAGEVFETLRTDPALEAVKVCIITGHPELRRLVYERAVRRPEGYLDKPVDEERLLLNVRKILELAHKPA
jgi:twitching motility two-component system response regulator PilH